MTHITTKDYVYAMSKDNAPVARVKPNQTFSLDTFDCFRNQMEDAGYILEEIDFAKVNPATGPVFVEGAQVGDTLAVTILDIELAAKGSMVSSELFGSLSHKLSGSIVQPVEIQGDRAEIAPDLSVPLSPMVGVIGTAPAEGAIACGSPGEHGGNMDTKEIKLGSVVYLPVNHDGGLLSLGDLHAAMGDGELSGTGIEIPGKVTLSVEVLKNSKLPTPSVLNDDLLTIIASDPDLDKAATTAVEKTHQYLMSEHQMTDHIASRWLSVGGDLGVSQIVNPLKTAKVTVDLSWLK
ncbi:acetamidase [Vibrio ishigakensis]|uniref:Acetamidase n=1 Tax=Vibrio ishigakensis TaxID=1481914 RepID=A0A0B8NSG3_9VIBR|nr:acetamidase/formamidase family protein [Vibrio ishigakensis]GAM55267.1 acetamidase [Vibrio ishigakensis]GAM66092.1 acetamidase [Vibrio ishigakensis]